MHTGDSISAIRFRKISTVLFIDFAILDILMLWDLLLWAPFNIDGKILAIIQKHHDNSSEITGDEF